MRDADHEGRLLLAGLVAADLAGVDAGLAGEVGLGHAQLDAATPDDFSEVHVDQCRGLCSPLPGLPRPQERTLKA